MKFRKYRVYIEGGIPERLAVAGNVINVVSCDTDFEVESYDENLLVVLRTGKNLKLPFDYPGLIFSSDITQTVEVECGFCDDIKGTETNFSVIVESLQTESSASRTQIIGAVDRMIDEFIHRQNLQETTFRDSKTGFRDKLFDASYVNHEAAGETPADLKLADGTPVVITPINAGSAFYSGGNLVLSTGADVAGGVIFDIGPIPYRSAFDSEAFLTLELLDALTDNVEVRAGWGSGTLDDTTPVTGEDAQGLRLVGQNTWALYRNGDLGENFDVPMPQWNGSILERLKNSAGDIIPYTPTLRNLNSFAYAYLGAVPGRGQVYSGFRDWASIHEHDHSGIRAGRNFARSDQYIRLLIRKIGGSDATPYRVAFASTSIFRVGSPMENGVLLTTAAKRTSQVLQRRAASAWAVGAATGNIAITDEFGTVTAEVPAGYIFLVTDYSVSGSNTSSGASGKVRFRDGVGGELRLPFRINESSIGNADEAQNINGSSPDQPRVFTTSVYCEVISGTVDIDVVLNGYLEPV